MGARAAGDAPVARNFADSGRLHAGAARPGKIGLSGLFGDVWQWTQSAYAPYPGYRAPASTVPVQRQVHVQPDRAARWLLFRARGPRPGRRTETSSQRRRAGRRAASGSRVTYMSGQAQGTRASVRLAGSSRRVTPSSPSRTPCARACSASASACRRGCSPTTTARRCSRRCAPARVLPHAHRARDPHDARRGHARGRRQSARDRRAGRRLGVEDARAARGAARTEDARALRARRRLARGGPRAGDDGLLRDLRHIEVRPAVARYPESWSFLRRPVGGRRLVLFLGSNVGNYDPRGAVELLAAVRSHLSPGDGFLMGVDRRKSPALLLPAYDDAAGVTSRFSKNLLTRLNREARRHLRSRSLPPRRRVERAAPRASSSPSRAPSLGASSSTRSGARGLRRGRGASTPNRATEALTQRASALRARRLRARDELDRRGIPVPACTSRACRSTDAQRDARKPRGTTKRSTRLECALHGEREQRRGDRALQDQADVRRDERP